MTQKERKLAKELGKCIGKWVVMDDDNVVACGDSVEEAEKKAKEAHIKKPVIFPLPDVEKGHGYF